MPYDARWYIENEVIYLHYYGAMDAEDLRAALMEHKSLIENSPRSIVHVINDVGDVTVPVPLKDSLRIVREVGGHVRSGWSLTIREKSIIIKMGAALGASVFKMRYRAFDTLEQALAHLKLVDESIHWDKVNSDVVKDK